MRLDESVSTHGTSCWDCHRAHTGAARAADIARQILRSDVRHWVVVGRNADIDILALFLAVHPDVLHCNCWTINYQRISYA